jgi:tetratricopeptide (TPR) repeat protein
MTQQGPLQLGINSLKDGKYDEAIRYLEQAAHENPDDYRSFNFLGIAYARKGLSNRAIGSLEAALKLAPRVASVHYNLGLIYKSDGFDDRAREHFQQALKLDPAYAQASLALKSLTSKRDSLKAQGCARHTDEPAVAVCSMCLLPVCNKCKREQFGKIICARCAGELPEDTWGEEDE